MIPALEIKNANFNDLKDILALQKEAYQSEAVIYDSYEIQPLTQTQQEIQEEFESKLFLKAVIGGIIIGSVRASKKDGTCLIEKLIVDPGYQGRGIGTALMSAIEGEFLSAESYVLYTGYKSEKNLHLYGKLGYIKIKEQKINEKLTLIFLQKSK